VKAVITTSEMLTDGIRAQLKSSFGVPVFNEYGCGEVGSIAHECERGKLHVMQENLLVEILDEHGREASRGELVVTDLHNRATPLLRYRLGDFASSSPEPCTCGRGLTTLERVHGRAYDFVRTPDGLRVHPEAIIYVFEMMKGDGVPVRQFQVEQVKMDTLVVRLVCSEGFTQANEQAITQLLHKHVSDKFRIHISHVQSIPRETSGKLRLVKSSMVFDAASQHPDSG
jgi:phenylacetate-CoA ligase